MSKDLYSDDWQVRRQAVEKLEQTELDSADLSGPPDPNLLEALQDKNPNVRAAAAVALVNNATQDGAKLLPTVANALKHSLPQLIDSLEKGDFACPLGCHLCCPGGSGPAAESVIPALREALNEENWLIRYSAAVALLAIDPRQTAAIPVLAELFRDRQRLEILGIDNNLVERDELSILGEIGSSQSLAVLIDLLQTGDEKLRYTYFWEDGGDRPFDGGYYNQSRSQGHSCFDQRPEKRPYPLLGRRYSGSDWFPGDRALGGNSSTKRDR